MKHQEAAIDDALTRLNDDLSELQFLMTDSVAPPMKTAMSPIDLNERVSLSFRAERRCVRGESSAQSSQLFAACKSTHLIVKASLKCLTHCERRQLVSATEEPIRSVVVAA